MAELLATGNQPSFLSMSAVLEVAWISDWSAVTLRAIAAVPSMIALPWSTKVAVL